MLGLSVCVCVCVANVPHFPLHSKLTAHIVCLLCSSQQSAIHMYMKFCQCFERARPCDVMRNGEREREGIPTHSHGHARTETAHRRAKRKPQTIYIELTYVQIISVSSVNIATEPNEQSQQIVSVLRRK